MLSCNFTEGTKTLTMAQIYLQLFVSMLFEGDIPTLKIFSTGERYVGLQQELKRNLIYFCYFCIVVSFDNKSFALSSPSERKYDVVYTPLTYTSSLDAVLLWDLDRIH